MSYIVTLEFHSHLPFDKLYLGKRNTGCKVHLIMSTCKFVLNICASCLRMRKIYAENKMAAVK